MPRNSLPGMQGQMQMDPRQMQAMAQGQQPGQGMPQGQMDPSQGQVDPRQMQAQQQMQAQLQAQQQMQEQQAENQQTSDAQASAFPQGQKHQVFIQEALKQGYSPDVVMNFLAQQLGQKQ